MPDGFLFSEGDLRTPPANLEVEQALLGTILTNNRALDIARDHLTPDDFAHPAHQAIYAEVLRRVDAGSQSVSPVTLKALAETNQDLQEAGGTLYLARLVDSMVSMMATADYCRLIADLSKKRRLIAIGHDMASRAYDASPDIPANEILEGAEADLMEIATKADQRQSVGMGEACDRAMETIEEAYKAKGPVGLTFGLRDLDSLLGGVRRDELVILAGRPAMGKTALALALAQQIVEARDPKPVFYVSMEMGADRLAARALTARAGVDGEAVLKGSVSEDDMSRLLEARRGMKHLPLIFDDMPGQTVGGIRARARRLHRTHGLGMIVVDHLGLIASTGREFNRVDEVSRISRGLKALAMELEVPVLALSQLNRGVEQREDKRPLLSDLRDSGSIEQDADKIMFCYRESYYLEKTEPQQRPDEDEMKFSNRFRQWQEASDRAANKLDVLVRKNRSGREGQVRLFYDLRTQRIDTLAGSIDQ